MQKINNPSAGFLIESLWLSVNLGNKNPPVVDLTSKVAVVSTDEPKPTFTLFPSLYIVESATHLIPSQNAVAPFTLPFGKPLPAFNA